MAQTIAGYCDFRYSEVESLGVTTQDFQTANQIIQLGYPPNRIDLITNPDGIDFQTCYDSKIEVNLDDVPVKFIDLDNLKKNKRNSSTGVN